MKLAIVLAFIVMGLHEMAAIPLTSDSNKTSDMPPKKSQHNYNLEGNTHNTINSHDFFGSFNQENYHMPSGYPSNPNSLGYPHNPNSLDYPHNSNPLGYPTNSNNHGYPTDSNNHGYPTNSNNHGYPTDSNNHGYPTNSNNHGYPLNPNSNHYPMNSHPNSGSYPSNNPQHGYGFGNYRGKRCPPPANFNDANRLSSVTTNYPAVAIAAELVARPAFKAVLDTLILTGSSYTLPATANLPHTSDICPSREFPLASFTTSVSSNRCWVLQNIQTPYTYVECLTRQCRSCKTAFSENTEKQCAKDYKIFGMFVYCENLALNSRITFLPVMIPTSCQCHQVYCYKNY